MDEWQKSYIDANLPALLETTTCDTALLACLRSLQEIGKPDVEIIRAGNTASERNQILYDLLQTRKNGYSALMKALAQTGRCASGAYNILKNGVYQIGLVKFKINLGNFVKPLGDFLRKNEFDKLGFRLQARLSCEIEIIHQQQGTGDGLFLVKNTVPLALPYYVPRVLSRLDYKGIRTTSVLSEEEFINLHQRQDEKPGVGIICDKTGMGKSELLANLARKISICTPDDPIYVAYIVTSQFLHTVKTPPTSCKSTQLNAVGRITDYISPSFLAQEILFELIATGTLKLALCFDGFDEIGGENAEWATFLKNIVAEFKNITVYVTCRPHMRNKLEETLGVEAYNITPFTLDNQIELLSKYWKHATEAQDEVKLTEFAELCLKNLEKTSLEQKRNFMGNPLQASLLAEAYSKQALLYSQTGDRALLNVENFSSLEEIRKNILEQCSRRSNSKQSFRTNTTKINSGGCSNTWHFPNQQEFPPPFTQPHSLNTFPCPPMPPPFFRPQIPHHFNGSRQTHNHNCTCPRPFYGEHCCPPCHCTDFWHNH